MTELADSANALVLYQQRTEDLSKALVLWEPEANNSTNIMSDIDVVVNESASSDVAPSQQPPAAAGSSRRPAQGKGKRSATKFADTAPSPAPAGPSTVPSGPRAGTSQRPHISSWTQHNTSKIPRNQGTDHRTRPHFAPDADGSESSRLERQPPPRPSRQNTANDNADAPVRRHSVRQSVRNHNSNYSRPLEDRLNDFSRPMHQSSFRETSQREPPPPPPTNYYPQSGFYSYGGIQPPPTAPLAPPVSHMPAPSPAPAPYRTAEAQNMAEKAMELALLGKLKEEVKSAEAAVFKKQEKIEIALELQSEQLKELDSAHQLHVKKELGDLERKMDQKFDQFVKDKLEPVNALCVELELVRKDIELHAKLRNSQESKVVEVEEKVVDLERTMRENLERHSAMRTQQALEAITTAKQELESGLAITRKYMEDEKKELRIIISQATEMEGRVMRTMRDVETRAEAGRERYEEDVKTLEEIRELTKTMTTTARGVEHVAEQSMKAVDEVKKMFDLIRNDTVTAKAEAEASREEIEQSKKTVAEIRRVMEYMEREARSLEVAANEAKRLAADSKTVMHDADRTLRDTNRFAEVARRAAEEAAEAGEQVRAMIENAKMAAEHAKRSSEEALKTATEARRMANETAGYNASEGLNPFRPIPPSHAGWSPPADIPLARFQVASGPPPAPMQPFGQFSVPQFPTSQTPGSRGGEADTVTSSAASSIGATSTRGEDAETRREIKQFKQVLYDAFFDVMADTRPWFQNEDAAMRMGMAGLGVQAAGWQPSQAPRRQRRRQQSQSPSSSGASSDDESTSTWQRSRGPYARATRGASFASEQPGLRLRRSAKSGAPEIIGASGNARRRSEQKRRPMVTTEINGAEDPHQLPTEIRTRRGQEQSDGEDSQASFHSARSEDHDNTDQENDEFDDGLIVIEEQSDRPSVSASQAGSVTSSRHSNSSSVVGTRPHNQRRHSSLMNGESSSRAMQGPGRSGGTAGRPVRHGTARSQTGLSQMAVGDTMPTPLIQQVFVGQPRGGEPQRPVRRRVYATSETDGSDGERG